MKYNKWELEIDGGKGWGWGIIETCVRRVGGRVRPSAQCCNVLTTLVNTQSFLVGVALCVFCELRADGRTDGCVNPEISASLVVRACRR